MAAAQRAGRRREAVARGPPATGPATRWPTSAGGTRWAPTSNWTVTPAADLPRRRPQGARLLHRTRRSCTTSSPRRSARSRCSATGARAPGIASSALDLPARAEQVMADHDPDLTLVYVPHLDYDLQRFGPSAPQAAAAAAELDAVLGPLLDAAAARGATVVALSEYGITDVSPAGATSTGLLRAEGLLQRVHPGRHGVPGPVDVAGVRRRRPPGRPRLRRATRPTSPAVAKLCAELPGVAEVLDDAGQGRARPGPRARRRAGAGRRAGRLVHLLLLARRRAARPTSPACVEIHRKPGYDPAELFFDPAGPGAAKAPGRAWRWLRKKLGMRYLMNVVGLDAGAARGPRLARPAARPAADARRPSSPVPLCSAASGPTGSPPPTSRPCCSAWPVPCPDARGAHSSARPR